MAVQFSSRRFNLDKPVKIQGRLVLEFTPADVGSISRYSWVLNPIQFGTTKVLDDLAHQFVWFRFTRFKPVIFSSSASIGNMAACAVFTYPPVSIPADLESIVESEFSTVCYTGQTVPSYMDLKQKELGQVQPKWFRVEPTGDDYLEYQGLLVWCDTNQGVAAKQIVVEYEIEFLGLADDPLTPAPVKRPGVAHEPFLLAGVKPVQVNKRARRAGAAPVHHAMDLNRRDWERVEESPTRVSGPAASAENRRLETLALVAARPAASSTPANTRR
jgi:hypothetical protein